MARQLEEMTKIMRKALKENEELQRKLQEQQEIKGKMVAAKLQTKAHLLVDEDEDDIYLGKQTVNIGV